MTIVTVASHSSHRKHRLLLCSFLSFRLCYLVKLRWPCLEAVTRFYDFPWQWQSTFNPNFVWQIRTRTKVGIPLNFAAGDMDRLRIYSLFTSHHVLAIRRIHPLTLTTRH